MEYCLLDVGIRRRPVALTCAENWPETSPPAKDDDGISSKAHLGPRFTYERVSYHSLLDADADLKALIRNVTRVPEYQFRERTDGFNSCDIILGVFLRTAHEEAECGFDYGCIKQRKQLIDLLFIEIEHHNFIEQELSIQSATPSVDGAALSVTEFYEQLRARHQTKRAKAEPDANHDEKTALESIVHSALRPELRPYQKEAIRWLIERETVPTTLPAQYVRLRCTAIPEVDFFADLYTYAVLDAQPQPIPIPSGGILADEMGLGKTVEILALLLYNNRIDECGKTEEHGGARKDRKTASTSKKARTISKYPAELKCLCTRNSLNDTLACEKCGRLQHRRCVQKNVPARTAQHPYQPAAAAASRHYLCPECWRTEPLVESRATIIVSPAAIKHQWASEIRKHIALPNFRLYLYNGVSSPSGWISPADLASYDVVLTDYNVLKPEIYFTGENARSSRHEKRFLSPASPLTLIRWWRVCLDEAQMVESLHNHATKMVKVLPAVHRWTVTGTPIEKTIHNLYGLVHYLDYAPYNNYGVWNEYAARFLAGNAEPLLTVMARIMWRTCKSSVLDQLGIPPQTERVHYITLSNLQRHFYRSEHAQCAQAFQERARKIGRSLSMAKLNIQTLNALMEPLRKLRHDCTIPSLLHTVNAMQTKRLLTPAELHEHLLTSNVNDCKAQLRSVASSLNGMAGIAYISGKHNQALALYEASLRLADEYSSGPITVDSLLQIHALHNLLELVRAHASELDPAKVPPADKLLEYEQRCGRLEWRYIEQYAQKVRAVEADLFPAIEKLEEMLAAPASLRLDGSWWRDAFDAFERDRTTARCADTFQRLLTEIPFDQQPPVETWRGLDLWLTTWWDKIAERRRTLKKGFQKLDFFVESLQPDRPCSPVVRARIETLVASAFACHLDPALAAEDDQLTEQEQEERERRPPAPTCLLCTVKAKLNQLEAVLFLRTVTQAATGGLWQISSTELILKHIVSLVKRQEARLERRIALEADHALVYLERAKSEFKEYSRYWVELNYTVAAYDELNMCRSRMQLVAESDLHEFGGSIRKLSAMQVLPQELELRMGEMQQAKDDAQLAFVRLQGTLKYLRHLGQKSEIDPCPICHTVPEIKYAVLQCGHHVCSICLVNLLRTAVGRHSRMSCVICRHQQLTVDLHYVTLAATTSKQVRGNHPAKVLTIVETVLDLMAQEPTVKIVIFSHWEPILFRLEAALAENDIKSRQQSSRYHKGVAEFLDPQQAVTCLLLPLRYGSKGLNLTEATHVFLVEPILNPGEELQAIGRIHRIGQTRPTVVHRFIVRDTIEQTIYETIQSDQSRWLAKDVTVEQLEDLFQLTDEMPVF